MRCSRARACSPRRSDGPLRPSLVRKRILIFLSGCAGLLLLTVATLPWWMGILVRQVGDQYGVTFTSYTTVGYGRWAIENVVWAQPGTHITVARVEGPHPLAWWWQKTGASGVVVDGLSVKVNAAEHVQTEGPGLITGPYSLVRQYDRILPWLPPLELRTGVVSWAEGHVIEVTEVILFDSDAEAVAVSYRGHQGAVAVRMNKRLAETGTGGGEIAKFEASSVADNWTLSGTMIARSNQVQIEGYWLDQVFAVEAAFVQDQWIPDSGKVTASNWRLPAAAFGLGEYYREITGDIAVSWSEGQLGFEPVKIDGLPLDEGAYPPFSIMMQGAGSLASAQIRLLQISTPGLTLEADRPFEISRESVRAGAVSYLDLSADLSKLPKLDATGRVDGRITVTTRAGDWPLVEGTLRGSDVKLASLPVLRGEVAGQLTWPTWTVSEVRLMDDVGGTITLSASGDAKTATIAAGAWTADVPGESLQFFLPVGLTVGRIVARGEVKGTWPEVLHAGSWDATNLTVPRLSPLDVAGSWTGAGQEITADVTTSSGQGLVNLTVQADLTTAKISAASIDHDGTRVVDLGQPIEIAWTDGWRVAGGAMSGPGISAELDYLTPTKGKLEARAQAPDLSWINDWWILPPFIQSVETIALTAEWDQGPLIFTGNVIGELAFDTVGTVHIAAEAEGDYTGTRIKTFRFGQNDREFANMSGVVPGYIDFFGETLWQIDREGAMDLNVLVAPNPAFWKTVGESQHITVSRPDIAVAVKGTWAAPQATGKIAVGRLKIGPEIAGYDWPEITDLAMTLAAELDGVRIDDGRATIDGQTVKWTGRLPVDEVGWSRLRSEPLTYLREQGAAHVEVTGANLATLAKFVPDYLVPVGVVSLDLSFSPGAKIEGKLVLQDAVSRPLGPLGVLQDIGAEIEFSDRTIQVRRLEALMGGQPVRVEGQAAWEVGMKPELNLKLVGTNLPLVRQTGLLLRGDLDLHVTSDAEGRGAVRGTVKLHDGLMLTDVRSLVPSGGGARRETRPPYFSVSVEPFAEWELDLEVQGDRFMRLRTPLLTGEASIAVTLDGTLRNPRALGDVTLGQGVVKLPFARFEIDEGTASLTEAQPYQPQLSFSGTGKRFGYDLTMELTGSANDPQLHLSSDPALPAADVVLMAMAGVAPKEEFIYSQNERALKLGVYFGQEIVSDLLGWEGDGRLSLSTGEKLSRRGKETYRVGYDWKDRWTVTGEYDEFDQYNAGLKWRWLPKPETTAEEEADASK
jgi:translocation and assembly module TamB